MIKNLMGQEMMDVGNITKEEVTIAARICYAYKAKNISLRSDYLQKTFLFDVERESCQNANTSTNVDKKSYKAKILNYTQLKFSPQTSSGPAGEFIDDVQTEQHGVLSQVCQRVFQGLPVVNTMTIAPFQVQIKFQRNTLDEYHLNFFLNKTLQTVKVFSVRTQYDWKQGMAIGMDERQLSLERCGEQSATGLLQIYKGML